MEHPEISQLEMEITWEEFENFLSLKKELEKLESEWQDVTEVQKLTHEKLQAIDDDFAQIEISRSEKMTKLYNRSGKLLKQNAFVPADVCQTVIDREILEMNNSVLKNHRQILNVKQICTHERHQLFTNTNDTS